MVTSAEILAELKYEGYADAVSAINATWEHFLQSGERHKPAGIRWPVPSALGIMGPDPRNEPTAIALVALFTRETGYLEGIPAWRIMGQIEGLPDKIELQSGPMPTKN